MAGAEPGRSFEYTPTWVVAVVCFVIVFISVGAERGLHKLGKLLLIIGTKLEHIITELAQDAEDTAADTEGTRIKPSDELFWFHRPTLVLYLIHFILFQNSFEIAFFFWIWSTYSFHSCIMDGLHFIIPRLIIGVIVQVLCSYSTLPLYALVTQMGSMFKQTVFDEFTQKLIGDWLKERKPSSDGALTTNPAAPISLAHRPVDYGGNTIELSRSKSSNVSSSSWN